MSETENAPTQRGSSTLDEAFVEAQQNVSATYSSIARQFQRLAMFRVAFDASLDMPPWETLRGWAREAVTASREGEGIDLERRWSEWQRLRSQFRCPKGHLKNPANTYKRKRRDSRSGKIITVRECRACRLETGRVRRNTARREGRKVTSFTFTEQEAAELGRYLFYRHNRTWLGDRMWRLFLQLYRQRPKEKS